MRILSLLVLLGGCMTPAAGEVPLTGTRWNLVELDGSPASGPWIEFAAEGQRLSGSGGCNQFGGAYELSGSRVEVEGPLMMTKRACAERERNETEAAFVGALDAMRSYEISGRMLTFYGADGAELARFESAPER